MRFEGKLAGMERRASYRSWDVYRAWILHRSGFDDAVQGRGGDERRGGGVGEARMMSPIIPWNTWAPRSPLRGGPAPFPVRLRASRARESVWKRARTLRHRRRPNCTTSAYYPPLNYSPLTTKIAPHLPQNPLSSFAPQDSLGFLHRYIFSVNAPRGSLF